MKRAKVVLTALMIGTMSLGGVSLAEAGIKLDDVHISVTFRNEERPNPPERREAPRPEARRPEPRPVDDRGPRHKAPGGPGRFEPRGPERPPLPPEGPRHGERR